MLNFILRFGNAKMLRFIVNFYKININEELENIFPFFLYLVHFLINFYKLDCIDYLLNESDLCFSYTAPRTIQENSNNTITNGISEDGGNNTTKKNNINYNNNYQSNNKLIVVNLKDMSDRKPLHLNDLRAFDGSEIIHDLHFMRYKKLFFVKKYSSKPLKADLSELLSY